MHRGGGFGPQGKAGSVGSGVGSDSVGSDVAEERLVTLHWTK